MKRGDRGERDRRRKGRRQGKTDEKKKAWMERVRTKKKDRWRESQMNGEIN